MLSKIDYLFKRLLDGTLTLAWDVYREGFWTFLKISFAVSFWNTSLWTFIGIFVTGKWCYSSSCVDNWYADDGKNNVSIVLLLLYWSSEILFSSIAQGGIILATAFIYANQQENITSSQLDWWLCLYNGGMKNGLALVIAAAITTLGTVCGIGFFFFPGIYLLVLWFVVYPAIVLEGCNNNISKVEVSMQAIQKSRILVCGSWCYCSCTALIGYLAFTSLWITFMFRVMIWDYDVFSLFTIQSTLLMNIFQMVALSILSIVQTVVYFNLRIEKEGMNFQDLLQNIGQTTQYGSYRLLETTHSGNLQLQQETPPKNNNTDNNSNNKSNKSLMTTEVEEIML